MKTVQTLFTSVLIVFTLACGYGSNYNTTAATGTTPAITHLNPAGATAGGAAFTLIVNGSNFGTKAVVNWNGVAQSANTTYVTGSQLMVAIPSAMIETAGTAQITVTNPATTGTGMYGTGGTLAETSTPVSFPIN